jgi:hypothetical protein
MLSVTPNCIQYISYRLALFLARVITYTLMMEATRSSETSACNKSTQCDIPEDDILQECTSIYKFYEKAGKKHPLGKPSHRWRIILKCILDE